MSTMHSLQRTDFMCPELAALSFAVFGGLVAAVVVDNVIPA